MCGINGIILKNQIPNPSEIRRMNQAIRHRGPDGEGILKFENCILGHKRLSIQDLSEKGHQPMSVDGRYWITFNGEIYNFKSIRIDLEKLGYSFFSNTDTEVILNAYKEWGTECFKKFNGMWSLCILDKKTKNLCMSRDRYGVKPFYYYVDNTNFLFSSEIKGLFVSSLNLKLDPEKCFHLPQELEGNFSTIYKNIKIVPPGTLFNFNLNSFKLEKTRWWKSLENPPHISPNKNIVKEELVSKLISATKLRLISDAKIATSLSGGLDSSVIFSILNKYGDQSNLDLNPFICQQNNKTFEEGISLAKKYNRKPIIIDEKINPYLEFKKNILALEMPMAYFNQLSLYKHQKALGVKVSLDGHGADECLGGYLNNIKFFNFDAHNLIFNIYNTVLKLSDSEKLKSFIKQYQFADNIKSYADKEITQFFKISKTINNKFLDYNILKNLHPLKNNFLEEDLEEMQNYSYAYQNLYSISNFGFLQWLLTKWDKASMTNSIEIRCPFMDYNFFEYSLSIPLEHKVNNGFNKSILREAFTEYLPEEITKSKIKQGLPAVPLPVNKDFLDYVKRIVNDKNFIEYDYWKGKIIKNEVEKDSFFNSKENCKDLFNIISIQQLDESMKDLKNTVSKSIFNESENYNLLTQNKSHNIMIAS